MVARSFRGCTVLVLGIALLVLGLLPARAVEGPAVSSRDVARQPCTDLLFVGARGSGEERPYGGTIAAVRESLLSRWTGTVTSVYIEYPATNPHTITSADIQSLLLDTNPPEPAYFASVDEGAEEVVRVLAHAVTACPQQRIVVVGFSQGAQVVTAALSISPHASRITATLLLGNPSHYPGQNIRELDAQVDTPAFGLFSLLSFLRTREGLTADQSRRGRIRSVMADLFALYEGKVSNADVSAVLSTSPGYIIPPSNYPHTFSVCAKGDVVCDAVPAMSRILASTSSAEAEFELARPAHLGYSPGFIQRSLEAVLNLLAESGKATRPSASATPRVTISPNATITPRPHGKVAQPAVAGRQQDVTSVLIVGGVAAFAGVGLGFVWGRRGRR